MLMEAMVSNQCTKEIFLKDVSKHKLRVIKDDGVYRHIRMSDGTFDLRYDIVTWPEYLCFTGDMGTYVFSTTDDMFEFFRCGELKINRPYWAEKVEAECRDGIKEYSPYEFRRQIECWSEDEEDEDKKQKIEQELMIHEFQSEHEARQAVDEFNACYGETFLDFWECDLTVYTYRFTWCCYAIVRAIQHYDFLEER